MQQQAYSDLKLVISYNAFTDDVEKVCCDCDRRDLRIRYLRKEGNLRAAFDYDRVFELARCDGFKYMVHDDMTRPTYLSECVNSLGHEGDRGALSSMGRQKLLCAENLYNPGSIWRKLCGRYDDICLAHVGRFRGAYPSLVSKWLLLLHSRRLIWIGKYRGANLSPVSMLCLRGRVREVPKSLYFERSKNLKERVTNREQLAWYDCSGNCLGIVLRELRPLLESRRVIAPSLLGPGARFWKIVLVLIERQCAAI